MENPRIIIIGGANGSGKTTLAREYVAAENIKYLGADEIASELNKANPENAAIEAARLFSRRLNDLLENRESFIVESTLSGLSLRKWIEKARSFGFNIKIVFVYLDSPELCIRRVAARVAKGGHHVPDKDIERRFDRSNRNFWHVYKELADEWRLFYNSGNAIIQIAGGDSRTTEILQEKEYSIWLELVKTENKTER